MAIGLTYVIAVRTIWKIILILNKLESHCLYYLLLDRSYTHSPAVVVTRYIRWFSKDSVAFHWIEIAGNRRYVNQEAVLKFVQMEIEN